MAADILIVDDEADIRELVAGILQDEGFGTRTARDSDDALDADRVAPADPGLPRHLAAGPKLDGLQLLDAVKQEHPELPVVMISGHGNIETAVAAIKRGAYDFIEKPFKADRLVLVAERALETSRLKREVKQLKQLAPLPATLVGKSPAINHCARPSNGGADQQPHPDRRALRLRQGTGRAHHPPALRARQRPLRRHQRRRDHARAHGNRTVRRRAVERPARPQGRRARGGAWRHAVHRRSRRHAARDPEQDPARAGRPDLPARRRHQQGLGRRAHRLLDRAQSRSARSPRETSARTSITACRWCRSACRRWPSGARTFPAWSTISWTRSRQPPACRSAASATTPWRCCSRTTGRATCASCATTSSG